MRTLVLNVCEKDKVKDLPVQIVETDDLFFKKSNSIILCSGSVCASRPTLESMTVWHILEMGTLTEYFNVYYNGHLLKNVEFRSATISGVLEDGTLLVLTRNKRVSLKVKDK
jgi:hypothetical protein